jgi:nicotinamidase/pyrazinamidase
LNHIISNLNKETTGVIVTDIQGDFTTLKNGSLGVPGTDQTYIDTVLSATKKLKNSGYPIFATKDFHPENHISFYTNHANKKAFEIIEINGQPQVLWPPHCVMDSANAEILIDHALFDAIVKKGMDPMFDSYSGFFDDGGAATGLDELLKSHKIDTLIIYGLATDYCVKATAMDAIKVGYDVILIKNLSHGVAPETTKSALEEMAAGGIKIIPSIPC